MTLEVDYVPYAAGGSANVQPLVDYIGSGPQVNGVAAGLAASAIANRAWRQASMMAAAWANVLSQRLGINVIDDGNLTNLIADLMAMLGTVQINITTVTADANTASNQNLMAGFALAAGAKNYIGATTRLEALGQIQEVNTTETVTFTLQYGGVNIVLASYVPTANSGKTWNFEVIVTTTTVDNGGGGGAVVVTVLGHVGGSVSAVQQLYFPQNGVVGSLSLAAGFTPQLLVSFGTASTTNNCAQNSLVQRS